MSDPDDAQITYTVKELLDGIKKEQAQGFARVEKGLEAKADLAHVERLERIQQEHTHAIDDLQGWRDRNSGAEEQQTQDSNRIQLGLSRWQAWLALVMALVMLAGVAVSLAQSL